MDFKKMKPYKEITTVKQTYVEIQKNVEKIYHILYLQANCLSTHLIRQELLQGKCIIIILELSSAEGYSGIVLAVPILQRFNSETDLRSKKFMINTSNIPQVVSTLIANITDINTLVKEVIKKL